MTGFRCYTMTELFEKTDADRRRIARILRWGSWRLKPGIWTLVHDQGYEVYLDECRTSAELLDWVFQVRNKRWATPEVMVDLLQAIHDILDPQANYCSHGDNLTADPKRLIQGLLRWRHAPPTA